MRGMGSRKILAAALLDGLFEHPHSASLLLAGADGFHIWWGRRNNSKYEPDQSFSNDRFSRRGFISHLVIHCYADEVLHGNAGGRASSRANTRSIIPALCRPIGNAAFSTTMVVHVFTLRIRCVCHSVWNICAGQTTSGERISSELIRKENSLPAGFPIEVRAAGLSRFHFPGLQQGRLPILSHLDDEVRKA